MKAAEKDSWSRLRALIMRLVVRTSDNRAAPLQGLVRIDSAEIWRLGQRWRGKYFAALLRRRRD